MFFLKFDSRFVQLQVGIQSVDNLLPFRVCCNIFVESILLVINGLNLDQIRLRTISELHSEKFNKSNINSKEGDSHLSIKRCLYIS